MNLGLSSAQLGQTLEHLTKHWETRRTVETRTHEFTRPSLAYTIALAREAGAQGIRVAQELGKRLHWPVYDHELLEKIARDLGVRASLLETVDERRKGWLLETVELISHVPAVSEVTYARHLVETILALGCHGECVIVGRGAAFILPRETTLRVRLVAPLVDRIRIVQQRLGLTHKQAEAKAAQMENERTAFIKTHFLHDPTDASNFDLVLNTSRYTPDKAAECIIDGLKHLFSEPR